MTTRNPSPAAPILLIILIVLTFPLWIGLGAGLFGLVVGLIGAIIGLVAGLFGILIGTIALPFKFIFGLGHGGWLPQLSLTAFLITLVFILTMALISRKK